MIIEEFMMPSFWLGILTHLWQTSLFILLLWVLGNAMRKAPGPWLERLWQLALLRLVLPGGWQLVNFEPTQNSGLEAARLVLTLPEQLVQPEALPRVFAVLFPVLGGLWVLGFLVHVLKVGRELQCMNRRHGRALEEMPVEDQVVLSGEMRELGLSPDHVRWTDEAIMPMVVGLLNPKIIMPRHLVQRFESDQLRAVLAHENSHRMRRDPLRFFFYSLIQAVLFFHPLWPLVLRKLKDSSEFIADETSLASGLTGHRYALALAGALDLKSPHLSVASGLRCRTSLAGRINRFNLKERNKQMLRYRFLIGFAVCLLALGMMIPVGGQSLAVAGSEADSTSTRIEGARPEPEDGSVQLNITRWAKPDYPDECRKAGIAGKVVVKVLVDIEGKVVKAQVLQGPECLQAAALQAAEKCLFRPAEKDGKQTEAWAAIPYEFRLE